jgi:hypothetical protein
MADRIGEKQGTGDLQFAVGRTNTFRVGLDGAGPVPRDPGQGSPPLPLRPYVLSSNKIDDRSSPLATEHKPRKIVLPTG